MDYLTELELSLWAEEERHYELAELEDALFEGVEDEDYDDVVNDIFHNETAQLF